MPARMQRVAIDGGHGWPPAHFSWCVSAVAVRAVTGKVFEMLCLHRKAGESVVIGGNVRVCVMKLSSGGVTLGIQAPREVSVDRDDVLQRKQAELERDAGDE